MVGHENIRGNRDNIKCDDENISGDHEIKTGVL